MHGLPLAVFVFVLLCRSPAQNEVLGRAISQDPLNGQYRGHAKSNEHPRGWQHSGGCFLETGDKFVYECDGNL